MFHLARGLRSLGHTIEIAAPADEPELHDAFTRKGLPFHNIPLDARLPFKAIFQLRTLLKRNTYTHIHVHGHRAAYIARPATATVRNRPKVIYTVHGYHPPHYPRAFDRWLVNTLERWLAGVTDAFICVSESVRNELETAIPNISAPRYVVENGIPACLLSPSQFQQYRHEGRSRFGISDKAFVLGTVARLQWQKGIHRLLQAFSSLNESIPQPIYLFIAGDGPDRTKLETLAKDLSLQDRCIFAGYCDNAKTIYPIMDLFVLPSLWEGLPLTILEAWDAGIPVVATNVSGTRDIIEDGVNGFLADDSTEGIACAIGRALDSSSQFSDIVKNATGCLLERFSVGGMVEQTVNVYTIVKP